MREIDAIEIAYNNGKEKGYIDGWNDAIDYIRKKYEKIAKKRGLNTDHQKLSEVTEQIRKENFGNE